MFDPEPPEECSIFDCHEPPKVKGMCKRHYNMQYNRSKRIRSERTLPKNHVLTPGQVTRIKRLHTAGAVTQADLARMFNVSGNTIWRIVHGETWRGVQ